MDSIEWLFVRRTERRGADDLFSSNPLDNGHSAVVRRFFRSVAECGPRVGHVRHIGRLTLLMEWPERFCKKKIDSVHDPDL